LDTHASARRAGINLGTVAASRRDMQHEIGGAAARQMGLRIAKKLIKPARRKQDRIPQ
jgi:hypothetical protein